METTIFPLLYGFMPNLGLYYRPDGSFENPSDLLPIGKIAEARRTQEAAGQACLDDCIVMSDCMVEMGADGIDYDTVASTGDAEFHAVLRTTEHVANETGLPVEIGMSAEMVLGFHGELEYNGKRLAGMWPHQQLQVCEEAGMRDLRPGRQHQHQEDHAVEPRRGAHLREGLHRDRQDPDSRQRGHGRRRRADVRDARPSMWSRAAAPR